MREVNQSLSEINEGVGKMCPARMNNTGSKLQSVYCRTQTEISN